ncbi:MAG TPA: hypothetical protein VKD71_04330 [Gemmataceae bacterium]|nr:hypothetical protein [Gemmataceae bacterium]
MKTLAGLMLSATLAALVGCATTDDDRYLADRPPALAKNDYQAPTTIEPVKLTTSRTPVTADEINESNYADMARRLDGELKTDGRASAKTGR